MIGGDVAPPDSPGQMIAIEGVVYMWSHGTLSQFDIGKGQWVRLPYPPGDRFSLRSVALRDLSGDLLVSANGQEACEGRLFFIWGGTEWLQLGAPPPQIGDCSEANQVAVIDGQLLIWGDVSDKYDLSTEMWSDLPPIPLRDVEGPPGPVNIGDRVLVPRWGEGAIYNPATDHWTIYSLPGMGGDTEMVWTGDEILVWGTTTGYFDAWRWSPPA